MNQKNCARCGREIYPDTAFFEPGDEDKYCEICDKKNRAEREETLRRIGEGAHMKMSQEKYHCPCIDCNDLSQDEEHCGNCHEVIDAQSAAYRPDWEEPSDPRWDGGCGRYLCEDCYNIHELK